MSAVSVATDANFENDVLKASQPVLVDFWAEWCGPCRTLAPVLDELSEEMGDSLRIVKIDIDKNPLTPVQYGVRSIPALLLFQDGDCLARKAGALPKSQLRDWVQASLD